MCYNCGEKDKLIHTVKSLLDVDKQRWTVIKTKSGLLDVVPEESVLKHPEEYTIIYQLNT